MARNWDGASAPDNAGDLRVGQVIVPGAPDIYLAILPYDAISAALGVRAIPPVFSDDTGGYVCNHTFFCARHEIEESGRAISCGFIHMPPIMMPLDFANLRETMQVCVEVVTHGTARAGGFDSPVLMALSSSG